MKKSAAQTIIAGLEALRRQLDIQDENGITLFNMIVQEKGTDKELRSLVTHRSLLNLILHTVAHQKTIRAMANSTKSNQKSIEAKEKAQALLHSWLDIYIKTYKGKLDLCATDATKQIRNLGRAFDWARKEITIYRKSRKS